MSTGERSSEGRWSIVDDCHDEIQIMQVSPRSGGTQTQVVCRVPIYSFSTWGSMGRAGARKRAALIVSAPQMLAALKAIVDTCNAPTRAMVLAAIAAAEGKS